MRRFWVGVLIFLGVVSILLSSLAYWMRSKIIDTDGFLALTDEVLDQREVQDAIVDRIVEQVFANPKVEAAIVDVIPEALRQFRGPIITGLREGLARGILFVADQEFVGDVVTAEVRKLHGDLVAGKNLTFGLSDAAAAFGLDTGDGVVSDAASLIPEDFGTITVLTRDQAPWLYELLDLLKNLWLWLFLVGLGLCSGAIAASRHRRNTVYALGLSVGIGALVFVLALQVGRSVALGSLPSDLSQSAADVTLDIVLSGLRSQMLWLAFIGFVLYGAALAWGRLGIVPATTDYAGKLWRDIRTRRARLEAATTDAAAEGGGVEVAGMPESRFATLAADFREFGRALQLPDRLQNVTEYVNRELRMLRGVGVIVGAVVLLLWPGPTTGVVIWIGALVVLYLGVLELLTARAASESPRVAAATATATGAMPAARAAATGAIPAPEAKEKAPATKQKAPEPEEPAAEPGAGGLEPEVKHEHAQPAPKTYEERLELLRELAELRTTGILTDEEIDIEKSKILEA